MSDSLFSWPLDQRQRVDMKVGYSFVEHKVAGDCMCSYTNNMEYPRGKEKTWSVKHKSSRDR